MPNYEEIVAQSQANVKSLGEKLKDLDQLYQDINSLKTKPENILLAFDKNFKEITEQFKQYQQTLGEASKMYLDDSNSLFISNLNELAGKNTQLETEISRLVNTNFTLLFADLQKVFIDKTSEDLAVELKRFEDNSTDFQNKILTLKTQISRLISTDFKQLFADLQKIFIEQTSKDLAVELKRFEDNSTDFQNKILTLQTQISRLVETDFNTLFVDLQKIFIEQTQKDIAVELDKIDAKITDFQTKIYSFGEEINRLEKVDLEKNFEKLQKTLSEQNMDLKTEIKTNKIIQIIGLISMISLLLGIILK